MPPVLELVQVPRSSKHVTEDQDYVLMSVVLFRRVVDDFKTAARVRGFQVGRARGMLLPRGMPGASRMWGLFVEFRDWWAGRWRRAAA